MAVEEVNGRPWVEDSDQSDVSSEELKTVAKNALYEDFC
jgi:hypothetical protein